MNYENWGAGQPRNFNTKNNMMMFKDGMYLFPADPHQHFVIHRYTFPDVKCMISETCAISPGTWANEVGTLKYAFVCKESPIPTCADGYFLFGSNCYTFKEEKLGFGEAQVNIMHNIKTTLNSFENTPFIFFPPLCVSVVPQYL